MSGFLIGALVLLLGCLIAVVRPLMRRGGPPPASGEALALGVLREQRSELDADLAAGRLDATAHAQGLAELAQRLAAEGATETVAMPPVQPPRRAWALAVAILLPLLAGGLYLKLGNPAALNPANTQAPEGVTPAQIEQMVVGLAAKVKANPDDLEGLQMLGRSYMVLGRFKEAVAAYETLAAKRPSAEVYADWADALGSVDSSKGLAGEPEKLIAKALQLDANNVKALALAGTVAFDRKDYRTALVHWERMATQIDPQSEMGQSAQAMIQEARNRATQGATAESSTAPPALRATGHLSLAAALKDKVAAGDTLFVFARPAAGGPPLAALRFRAEDLPLDFDFSMAQAMMGATVDGKVVIGARISKSGNATPSAGDLEGFTTEVAPDAQGIALEIDTERK
ncbi:MAG: c-type cytochrome biogenesis protein CcmI [Uliginosibacterium sp.]|nr:c-type cytochrome biogenesis protein CcmI [Uliginosibacterium sp.]